MSQPPTVAHVRMIPSAVIAQPGATVRLKTQLLTPSNKIIHPSQNVQVTWKWTAHPIDNANVGTSANLTPSSHHISLKLPATATPGSLYSIRAAASGVTGDATIQIADGGDRILAADATENETLAALKHPPCPSEDVVAFVGAASLSPQHQPCPLGLFTPDFALPYLDAQWTTTIGDIVDYRGLTGPTIPGTIHRIPQSDPDPMELRVWIAAIPGPSDLLQDIAAEAQDNVQAAEQYLRRNRVGILPTVAELQQPGIDYVLVDATDHCEDPSKYPQLFSHAGIDLTDAKRLYVFYVRNAVDAGVTCLPKAGRAGLIFISAFGHTGNTLAHELGHALALTGPGFTTGTDPMVVPQLPHWGHSENVPGLGVDNLMLGTLDPTMKAGRQRLSIGQVFRMNVDGRSWINVARPQRVGTRIFKTLQCQKDITTEICPPLAIDVPIG